MTRAQTERIEKRIKDAIGVLEALVAPHSPRSTVSVIADLLRRAEQVSTIDGMPRGGGGERVSGGGAGDPTFGAVAAREADQCGACVGGQFKLEDGRTVPCRQCGGSGRRWPDPVNDGVEEILLRLGHVARGCREIDRKRKAILNTREGRESSLAGSCVVCDRTVTGASDAERLKRGMDNACYLAWGAFKMRHGETDDPGSDFMRFTLERRKFLKDRAEREMVDVERLQAAGNLPTPSRG